MRVTSTSIKDLTTSRMDKRIRFESCSTNRRRSCSTTRRRSCSTTRRRSCLTTRRRSCSKTRRRSWSTNQKEKLLDNQKEKLVDKPSFSNQSNQLQIQFVIDQGDLMTYKMKETRPFSQEINNNSLTKNSVLQIEQDDLLKQR